MYRLNVCYEVFNIVVNDMVDCRAVFPGANQIIFREDLNITR